MEPVTGEDLDRRIDDLLSSDVVAHITRARAELEQRMAEAGLHSKDGWSIQEELRDTETGTRWVFRPVHLRHDAPDLQSSVTLDHDGRAK